jgi:hypothetical protein
MCNVYRVIPFCFVAGSLFLLPSEARAQIAITNLYNTGFGVGGIAAAPFSPPASTSSPIDGNWSIVGDTALPTVLSGNNDPDDLGPTYGGIYYPDTAVINPGLTPTGFLSQSASITLALPTGGSNWIGPSSAGVFSDFNGSDATTLTYQTTFTLPSNATSVSISGLVSVDNSLDEILLNGVSVGAYATGSSLANLTGDQEEAFTQMNPISFSSSNVVAGTNTLDFVADNDEGSPTGIDINISGTYVPEPASASLLSVAAVGLLSRRRRRQQPCPPSST